MKHDATGRSKSGRFARLDHSLLSSPAYRSLSPNGRSLLVELAMMENGKNNGELFLSVRDAADRMGVADVHAAINAFAELEGMGFIACTRDGHFAVKAGDGSRARCWRITWQSTPCLHSGPTNEFHHRQPEPGSRASKRMAAGCKALKRLRNAQSSGNLPVVESITLKAKRVVESTPMAEPKGDERVVESDTRFLKNGRNPPNLTVVDSATHTAYQLEEGSAEHSASGHSKAREAGCDSAAVRQCEHCRADFTLARADRAYPRRFCSEPCRKAAEKARYQERRREGASGEAQSIGAVLTGVLAQAGGGR